MARLSYATRRPARHTGNLVVSRSSGDGAIRSLTLPRDRKRDVTALRQHNARASLQNRVPPEVWCIVWALLHQTDRMAVTHVCSTWRALAISCPAVWSNIDAVVVAHRSCRCANNDEIHWESHLRPALREDLRSNLRVTQNVLARTGSGNARLSLNVQVLVRDHAHAVDWAGRLASVLAPYAARLQHIHVAAESLEFPAALLDRFDALPALRGLTSDMVSRYDVPPPVPFTSRALVLPNLRNINLDTPGTTWPSVAGFAIPHLATLSIHVCTTAEIVRALDACPQLAVLHLNFALEDEDAAERTRTASAIAVHCRSGRIREVVIDEVARTTDVCPGQDWVFAAFGHPQVKALHLLYEEFSLGGLRTFWDIGGDIDLGITLRGQALVFRATDSTSGPGKRVRSVRLPFNTSAWPRSAVRAIFSTLWAAVTERRRLRDIDRLTVDASLYCDFLRTLPAQNFLTQLTVVLFEPPHVDIMIISSESSTLGNCNCNAGPPRFPALHTLRITRADASIPALCQSQVDAVLKSLSLAATFDSTQFIEPDSGLLAGRGETSNSARDLVPQSREDKPDRQFRGLTVELTVLTVA